MNKAFLAVIERILRIINDILKLITDLNTDFLIDTYPHIYLAIPRTLFRRHRQQSGSLRIGRYKLVVKLIT